MQRIPWTKFQDFYLRLGFLKVLVAVLDPHRRSISSEAVTQRLNSLLFRSIRDFPELQGRLQADYSWFAQLSERRDDAGAKHRVTVTDALLVIGDCGSQLPAVTASTAHKLLEWGRDVGFVGSGNQIAESGLLLRALLPDQEVQRFRDGCIVAWNPFTITPSERLYFLFHFCDIDHMTLEIIVALARKGLGPLETSDASKIACHALFKVLDRHQGTVPLRELPRFRVARDLACAMAAELDISELKRRCGPRSIARAPNRARIGSRPKVRRRTTKNSDHQTIARFEQLIDLGFVTKPIGGNTTAEEEYRARRRWKYEPTSLCASWTRHWSAPRRAGAPWHWYNFSDTVVRAGIVSSPTSGRCELKCVARHLWNAYVRIRRSVGHTPLQSVALLGMIEAASVGHVVELEEFREVLAIVKDRDLLSEHAFFSGGNEIDGMFILLKRGFLEAFDDRVPEIEKRRA